MSSHNLPILPAQEGRSCGGCSLCCRILPIDDLEKPAGRWCEHFRPHQGCGIYATRPAVCRAFRCGWLDGAGPEEARPDRAGFILSAPDDGTEGLVVTLAKSHQGQPLPEWLSIRIGALVHRGIPVYLFVEGRGGYQLGTRT